jgi:ABC-type lipoprotein export system ATPase subunit
MPDATVADRSIAVACRGIGRIYRTADEEVQALRDVDKDFPAGRVTAIVGPSGSGKSSLLRILSCVDRPDTGTIHVGQTNVGELGRRARRAVRRLEVAYIFQDPIDNLVEYLTSIEQLQLAGRLRGIRPDPAELTAVLEILHLDQRADHRPAQLSGGEQQRLAVACAVVGRPAVVVADEPTAELDTRSSERVLEAFRDLSAEGVSFIVSSHDPQVVAAADHLLRLDHGRVTESW